MSIFTSSMGPCLNHPNVGTCLRKISQCTRASFKHGNVINPNTEDDVNNQPLSRAELVIRPHPCTEGHHGGVVHNLQPPNQLKLTTSKSRTNTSDRTLAANSHRNRLQNPPSPLSRKLHGGGQRRRIDGHTGNYGHDENLRKTKREIEQVQVIRHGHWCSPRDPSGISSWP